MHDINIETILLNTVKPLLRGHLCNKEKLAL
jgi:hypothetical protein